MKLHLVTPTSVSVELENNDSYYTEPFSVFFNGIPFGEKNVNSFSFYHLTPNQEYQIEVKI